MKFLAFHKLGENRQSPRVWIESQRLDSLGFSPGGGFTIEPLANKVRLRPAVFADNHVSSRISGGQKRPIVDIANRLLLAPLVDFAEIRIAATFRQIDVTPSTRAFHIRRGLQAKPPFKTIEVFAGGGTLSAAIKASSDFHLVAGIEIEPKYADVWHRAHPHATLVQADVRRLHPSDLPAHDVLIASIAETIASRTGHVVNFARKILLTRTPKTFVFIPHRKLFSREANGSIPHFRLKVVFPKRLLRCRRLVVDHVFLFFADRWLDHDRQQISDHGHVDLALLDNDV